jgi:DNA replication protein DnaC
MNELQLDRILDHCQRLGLLHVQAGLSESLRRAQTESWGHVQLLDHLLEEEIASRESRRIKNALKLAAFPFLKTLDAFDFAFQPSLDKARVMDLAALTFLGRKENVLLLGPPGVGKTHRDNYPYRSRR